MQCQGRGTPPTVAPVLLNPYLGALSVKGMKTALVGGRMCGSHDKHKGWMMVVVTY